jgi:hypothetical protein
MLKLDASNAGRSSSLRNLIFTDRTFNLVRGRWVERSDAIASALRAESIKAIGEIVGNQPMAAVAVALVSLRSTHPAG